MTRTKKEKKHGMTDGNEGFTIVELLISLALLSFLTLLSIQGIRTIAQMNRVSQEVVEHEQLQSVERYIIQSIESARAVFMETGEGKSVLAFTGSASSLEFVTNSKIQVERGGLYLVRLFVVEGNLTTERRLFRPGFNGIAGRTKPLVLIEKVKGIAFRYFGKVSKKDTEAHWVSDWPRNRNLPTMLSVKIFREKSDGSDISNLLVYVPASSN